MIEFRTQERPWLTIIDEIATGKNWLSILLHFSTFYLIVLCDFHIQLDRLSDHVIGQRVSQVDFLFFCPAG